MKRTMMTLALLATFSGQALATQVANHKSPYCGCCTEWTKHMEENGFTVKEVLHDNMDSIKQQLGVKPKLASCHTAEIGGYVFEAIFQRKTLKIFWLTHRKMPKGSLFPECLWVHRVWNMAIRKTVMRCMPLMSMAKSLNTALIKGTDLSFLSKRMKG